MSAEQKQDVRVERAIATAVETIAEVLPRVPRDMVAIAGRKVVLGLLSDWGIDTGGVELEVPAAVPVKVRSKKRR